MTKKKNPLWAFFSSVKLALFLLFILAGTSIIGTIILQNKPNGFYVKQYGANIADLMLKLGITDMYNSWWFLSLLGIFSLNLIICSLERIPNVIRIIRKDNLSVDPERFRKMSLHAVVRPSSNTTAAAKEQILGYLSGKSWKTTTRDTENGSIFFAQKGSWTRFGVYIVHASILIILLGAVIGSSTFAIKILHKPEYAFKGSIMIPETGESDCIYTFQTDKKIDLGFSVRCNSFTIEYYSNGMPRTYLSKISILENGKPVVLGDGKILHDLKVNKPLTYKGITFYQSSYQAYSDFVVSLTNTSTGFTWQSIIPAGKELETEDGAIAFGIVHVDTRGEAVQKMKIWFTDHQKKASIFWINNNQEAVIQRPSGEYKLRIKQLYATGLQVTKDPGVWWVYSGCAMMLIGLFVAFFMSHRKIWAYLYTKEGRSMVIFAGSANKNKTGFEKTFTTLAQGFSPSRKREYYSTK